MLRSHLAVYKNTNNEVAIATIFVSGIRTRRRDTFLVPMLCVGMPPESIQRKGGSIAASSCAPRFCRGSVERASCPPTDARHPCRAPSG